MPYYHYSNKIKIIVEVFPLGNRTLISTGDPRSQCEELSLFLTFEISAKRVKPMPYTAYTIA